MIDDVVFVKRDAASLTRADRNSAEFPVNLRIGNRNLSSFSPV